MELVRLLAHVTICANLLLTSGCSFLLPRSTERVKAPWDSFSAANEAFDQIVPGETTVEKLAQLGYDPGHTRNVTELDYLSLVAQLVPGNVLRRQDMPEGLRRCIAMQDECRAYRAQVDFRRSRRKGFWLIDLLRFRRQEETKGWSFTGTAVIADGTVVYKAWSGTPSIYRFTDRILPLGPLQDPSGVLLGVLIP